jgi:exo-1,4-beta-D-glucosaminidase
VASAVCAGRQIADASDRFLQSGMAKRHMAKRLCKVAALLSLALACVACGQRSSTQTPLSNGWKLQSSCVTHATGDVISSAAFVPEGWIDTTVPHTVLGAQVDAGIFPDPYFGKNIRDIPGTDYPVGKIFAYLPMSDSSPYHCSWWYRKEFTSSARPERSVRLHFDGINYRANLWLNGKQFATSEQVAGAFRAYDFEISDQIARGANNVLAVEVFAQTENDLGIDFLDWNPAPADKDMGLWRDVSLVESGRASLEQPFVSTRFGDDALSTADLTVAVDVVNRNDSAFTGTVSGSIGDILFTQTVELKAGEQKEVRFDVEHFPQLRVSKPRVWWPYQYGEPNLENLRLTLTADGVTSDEKSLRFGIREAHRTLDANGHTLFQINRRNILIRGGGWTPDLFYRESYARNLQELQYVKAMNLNTIRLEGKLGSEDLFDLADKLGILVMAGWQCCDEWQKWEQWTAADRAIAHQSMYSQISRLRSHPSLLVWLNGSDEVPSPEVEKDFLNVLAEREWPAAVLSTAADRKSTLTGPSGVKMSGPYDYVPPEYWYLDKKKAGGAFGFNTETSPGAAIPLPSSIRRTLPKASWWPIDDQWKFHAGSGRFAQYDRFNQAMESTYGKVQDAEPYNLRAQWMAYDGERAMFEAYGANKYSATGVIQWMLNNAWPSFIWHLYDYYLVPGGGFFGTKKANEPLHVQYRYDDAKIAVVNSTLDSYKGLEVSAEAVALDGKSLFKKTVGVDVGADGVVSAQLIPPQVGTTFLRLELSNREGKVLSKNFYVVPAKVADLDWEKSDGFYTPAKSYADMRDLNQLGGAQVVASAERGSQPGHFRIRLRNTSRVVAFCLQVRATEKGVDKDVAPAFWSDNYLSLLPNETAILELDSAADARSGLTFTVQGWNVTSRSFAPTVPHRRGQGGSSGHS